MAIPINAASAILTGGQKPSDDRQLSEAASEAFERRVDAHAERLWREAGRVGSAADYRDEARAVATREEMPQEAESTG